jgi:hypothetical protein
MIGCATFRWEIGSAWTDLYFLDRQTDLTPSALRAIRSRTQTATVTLETFHGGHSRKEGLIIAIGVVLLAWALPLACAVRDSIRYRRLALRALRPVSDVVRWTYAVALVAIPVTAIGWLLVQTHLLAPGMLARLIVMAALGGLALLVATTIGTGVRGVPGPRPSHRPR